MVKKLFSAIALSVMTLAIPVTATAADSVGEQLSDNDRIISFIHDNMSYYFAFDTQLRDNTVIPVVNEKGDAVPDGKGPAFCNNSLVSSIENPLSLDKRGYEPTYSYSKEVLIAPLNSDYYTFLGWNYDYSSVEGEVSSPVVTDTSSLQKTIRIEKGSQGSRHYTAYWRQNLLNILYNAGKDYKGVYAVNSGSQAYSVEKDGRILKDGDARVTSIGSEQSAVTECVDSASALRLVLPDYHVEKGKEWVDADGRIFPQNKSFYSTQYAEAIKDGDAVVSFTANWIPNVYTLTYDFGKINSVLEDKSVYNPVFDESKNSDGYLASATSGSYNRWTSKQQFTIETEGDLPVPALKDHSFTGWYTSSGAKVITWDDLKAVTEADNRDVTLMARWEEDTFTLSYDFDRNDLPEKLAVSNDVVAPKMGGYDIEGGHNDYSSSESLTISKSGNLPVPSREFYTFNGWYYGDDKVSTYKQYLDLTDGNDRDATLEADWSPVKYQITYDYDAENLPAQLLVDTKAVAPEMSDPLSGADYTVKGSHNTYSTVLNYTVQNVDVLPTPERDYYSFEGWQLGDSKVTTYKEFFNEVSSHTGTVEGLWTPDEYTITYVTDTRDEAPDDCRDTIELSEAAVKEYTVETKRQSLLEPSMLAYDFETWHSSTNDKDVSDLTSLEPLGDAVLTAGWKPVEYTITWNNKGNRPGMVNAVNNRNSGTFTVADTQSTFTAETYLDRSEDVFSEPSASGYTFNEWKLADGTKVEKASDLEYKDATIKADWDINTYTISFDTQELSSDEWGWADSTKDELVEKMEAANSSHLTYNAEDAFTVVNPTLQHNVFKGWSGTKTGSSITIQKGTTGDISLISNWTQSHTYLNYVVDSKASCTSNGSKHRDCKYCGGHGRQNTVISARGHSYSNKVTKDSTCTAEGNRHYTCTHTSSTEYVSCNHSYDAPIAKKAHTYTWVTTKAATCTAAGTKAYKCSACGDVSQTGTIAALGHTGNGGWSLIASWDSAVANPTGVGNEQAGINLVNATYNTLLAPYGLSGSLAYQGNAIWTSGNPYNNYGTNVNNGVYYGSFGANVFHKADGSIAKAHGTTHWIAANNGAVYQRTCARCHVRY